LEKTLLNPLRSSHMLHMLFASSDNQTVWKNTY
jgi:hypothetical protein